jgi:hypothetical protein
MRFLEIARVLNAQAMRHETQAWLEAQATSTPMAKRTQLDKPINRPALTPKRKPPRPKRLPTKSPIPQQARSVTPSQARLLPSSQPVLRPTHSSSFSQGDLHGLQQAYMASPGAP